MPNALTTSNTPNQEIHDPTLDAARQAVADARQNGDGIFDAKDPVQLMPFELRFLGRTSSDGATRTGPDRWIIDLSQATDLLLSPQRYAEIPNIEDRLFVNAEDAPNFVEPGWSRA